MKFKTPLLLTLVSCFLVSPCFSQKYLKKDWHKWSLKEVTKIINDSPWAPQWSNIDTTMDYNILNRNTTQGLSSSPPAPPIVLRFYSSLTIRRALLRLQQLGSNYDKMDPAQKEEFDQKTSGALACANCKHYYVFILLQPTSGTNKSLVADRFKNETLETLKENVYLEADDGRKRELAQFVVPADEQGAAIFYFPIVDDENKPLIDLQTTKKITWKMRTGFYRNMAWVESREFDISDMLVNGSLDIY